MNHWSEVCEIWYGDTSYKHMYEGRLKSSWSGGGAPLLCRGRRWHAKL